MSVNCDACTCEMCSLWLTYHDDYKHVVAIDLAAFRSELGMAVSAVHDPIHDPGEENPCHFLLQPDEDDIEVFAVSFKRAYKKFCEPRKVPGNPGEKQWMHESRAAYDRVFRVFKDVDMQRQTPL